MGLDGVELIMAVEETFGVAISDADAATLTTPRRLIDCVLGKLRLNECAACSSQRAFYLLRRAFVQEFGVARRAFSLDTPLTAFFPAGGDIRPVWERLRERVQVRRWPVLRRPLWMSAGITVLSLLVAGGIPCWVQYVSPWGGLSWLAALPLGVAVIAGALRVTRPCQTRLPWSARRVRDLVPYAESSSQVEWNRDAVARKVKELVMEILGLAETQYREDADFVKDLGLG